MVKSILDDVAPGSNTWVSGEDKVVGVSRGTGVGRTGIVSSVLGNLGAHGIEYANIPYDMFPNNPLFRVSGTAEINKTYISSNFNDKVLKGFLANIKPGTAVSTGQGIGDQIDLFSHVKVGGKDIYEHIKDVFPTTDPLVAIQAYLLRTCICYVEVPTTKVRFDSVVGGYTKFLATANYQLAEQWLSFNEEGVGTAMKPAMLKKFQAGTFTAYPETDGQPYVKPVYDVKSGEFKLTNPRGDFDFTKKGTRVTPLFVMEGIADRLVTWASEGFIEVNYFKEGGEPRKQVVTLDPAKVKEIYQGTAHEELEMNYCVGEPLSALETTSRGYLRLPSIGESVHTSSINRSVSLTRLQSIKLDVEPDLDNLYTNTSLVVPNFRSEVISYLEDGRASKVKGIISNLHEFELLPYIIPADMENIDKWLDRESYIKGTAFFLELANFMVSFPDDFPAYQRIYKQDRDTSKHQAEGTAYKESNSDEFGLF